MLVANAIIDIIIASWTTSKNSENSGNEGSGKPFGMLPTIARLYLVSSLAKYVTTVPVIIFRNQDINSRKFYLINLFLNFKTNNYKLNGQRNAFKLLFESFIYLSFC